MSQEFIILITIISLLFVFISAALGFIFYKFKKSESNEASINPLASKRSEKEVQRRIDQLNKSIEEYRETKEVYENKLQALSTKSQEELKEEIITLIKNKEKKSIDIALSDMRANANIEAANILVNTMQSIAEPLIQEHTTSSITVEDDQTKGRIIGREGRNKRAFEITTGTDLIIEKDSNLITVSSHNPIRREVARLVLEELIKIKSIDPMKIESIYEQVKSGFDAQLNEIGRELVEDKLEIHDLNHEVYPYLGRLKFRSSYGQNALSHSYECACIADSLAHELKLDRKLAMECALLHDIGKSMDQELNSNHIDIGKKIALDLNLSEEIVNSIESHHGAVLCSSIYAEIAKLADSISAARPGARINSYEEYFTRVQELENIIDDFDEVKQAFVIKSGRHVRVMVNPLLVNDNELQELGERIKEKIETNNIVKGYNIKVTLIKENKYEFETQSKQDEN